MRIEAYTQVQQMYQTKKVDRPQRSASVPAADKVQISSIGRDFQTAKAAVAAASNCYKNITKLQQKD